MTTVLVRAIPFIITLIIGTGLGNIFGVHKPTTDTFETRRARCEEQNSTKDIEHNSVEMVTTQPMVVSQPSTRYTPEALENRTTGVVTLLVRFNADGTTSVVKRLSTLPDGLTEDAERVAKHTRFTPATANGTPITESREMHYVYSLVPVATHADVR